MGHWRYHPEWTDSDKKYLCCGWDEADFRWNTDLCGNASLAEVKTYSGSPTHLTMAGGHACHCDATAKSRYSISERERYEWVPSYCDLVQWNSTQFCELLGNRTVLMVGDSTMMQSGGSLMSMITYGGGKCAPQISAHHNNELFYGLHGSARVQDIARVRKPNVLIMTAGAHLHDEGDLWTLWHYLPEQIKWVRENLPETKILWRTNNPGNLRCESFHGPEPYDLHNGSDVMDWYQWNLQPRIDMVSIEHSIENGMGVIDMSPLYERPDSHPKKDCLHNCLPGPIDLFATLLMQKLFTKEI